MPWSAAHCSITYSRKHGASLRLKEVSIASVRKTLKQYSCTPQQTRWRVSGGSVRVLTWGRFAEIEQGRLIRLALGWLKEDRKRRDFTVVAIEAKRKVVIGGLTLTTRLDRVDELDDGRRIIIDYKTRAPSVTTMLGDRPEEPQLPVISRHGRARCRGPRVCPGQGRQYALHGSCT